MSTALPVQRACKVPSHGTDLYSGQLCTPQLKLSRKQLHRLLTEGLSFNRGPQCAQTQRMSAGDLPADIWELVLWQALKREDGALLTHHELGLLIKVCSLMTVHADSISKLPRL